MMEKVSVIIPTYNRKKTLLRALQSVLNQTYTNLEVLIIDDGSTDGTADVVKTVEDERVKYIVLEKNGGPSNARNIGVQMASSEWIAFQDSDDCWHESKLEKQIAYLNSNSNVSLIYCMGNVHMADGKDMLLPGKPWPDIMEGNMTYTLLQRNVVGTPTMLINRQSFLAVGGFDTTYRALEDWEFVLRFSKEYEIGFVREALMEIYMLANGVSSNLGAYFEARCKMLRQYRPDMIREGVLEIVMQDIQERALQAGVFDAVKNMMAIYLNR